MTLLISSTLLCRGGLNPSVVSCLPQCWARVHVLYDKPVQLDGDYLLDGGNIFVNRVFYGSSQAEVVLETDLLAPATTYTLVISDVHSLDGFVMAPNPTNCVFRNGFGGFCADFNDNLPPPGAAVYGSATLPGDGSLHLTDAGVNSAVGSFFIPDRNGGMPLSILQAHWRSLIGGGSGADGYSFSWANDLPAPPNSVGEEGAGSGLIVEVDTFDDGAGEGPAIDIKWRGEDVVHLPVAQGFLRQNQFVDVDLNVGPDGKVSLGYGGVVVANEAQLPGFAPISGGNFLFSARTGGLNDNHWIDDVCLNDFQLGPTTVSLGQGQLTVKQCSAITLPSVASGSPPYHYQWYRNGTPIPGATASRYTTPALQVADNGTVYKLVVSNACSTASDSAAVVVIPATGDAPPNLLSALLGPGQVKVVFDKTLDPASASSPGNYSIGGGVIVTGAVLQADGKTVLLTVSPLQDGVCYFLTVNGVTDACPGNPVAPGSMTPLLVPPTPRAGPRLRISLDTNSQVVLTWDGTGCRLQGSSSLGGSTTNWHDLAVSSPFTMTGPTGNTFYRLIFP